jgi:hypothetical protein
MNYATTTSLLSAAINNSLSVCTWAMKESEQRQSRTNCLSNERLKPASG